MTTRREFLTSAVGLAGVCFVGCGLLGPHRAHAQPRRTVKIGGKRVKVVDVHAHAVVPEALELAGLKLGEGIWRPEVAMPASVDQRIAAMDAQGIDVQIRSLAPPGTQPLDPADALPLAMRANDIAADAVRRHPRSRSFPPWPTRGGPPSSNARRASASSEQWSTRDAAPPRAGSNDARPAAVPGGLSLPTAEQGRHRPVWHGFPHRRGPGEVHGGQRTSAFRHHELAQSSWDRAKVSVSPRAPPIHTSWHASAISASPSVMAPKTLPGTQPWSPLMSRLLRP
jgi:hypothetical protein